MLKKWSHAEARKYAEKGKTKSLGYQQLSVLVLVLSAILCVSARNGLKGLTHAARSRRFYAWRGERCLMVMLNYDFLIGDS